MVLLNDWRKLLRSIGGFQYVKDLKGSRKTFYENLREDSLKFAARRNQLRKDIDTAIRYQHQLVNENALKISIEARDKPWDNATLVEIEAEEEENRECCRFFLFYY